MEVPGYSGNNTNEGESFPLSLKRIDADDEKDRESAIAGAGSISELISSARFNRDFEADYPSGEVSLEAYRIVVELRGVMTSIANRGREVIAYRDEQGQVWYGEKSRQAGDERMQAVRYDEETGRIIAVCDRKLDDESTPYIRRLEITMESRPGASVDELGYNMEITRRVVHNGAKPAQQAVSLNAATQVASAV